MRIRGITVLTLTLFLAACAGCGGSGRVAVAPGTPPVAMPRVVTIGNKSCPACKAMKPVLKSVRREYAGQVSFHSVDLSHNPGALLRYGVSKIPTLVFQDACGREVYRHVGYYSPEEIAARLRWMGVPVDGAWSPNTSTASSVLPGGTCGPGGCTTF